MDGMPRPRPPHLHRERTRHGAVVWYVRVDKGPRIRIKEAFGTQEFWEAYRAAVAGEPVERKPAGSKVGTLRWLVERYRDSQAWMSLSLATRRQRELFLSKMLEQSGDKSFSLITRATVQSGIDRRKATPFQAKHFLDTLRGLFKWALTAQHVKADPTLGIRAIKPATDGFHAWTDEEIAKFETCWPIGTKQRLAFDLLLYTGLRRGDVVRLGRQHVRDGIITLRTEKTGEVVVLPILPELASTIAASKTGDLTFIVTEYGRPMVKAGFGNWFRDACKAAGVPGSAHGLRKAGATRAADNGATEAQLEAIFGWRGGHMASLYTKAANRKRLAMDAMSKMSTDQSVNSYSRTSKSGAGQNSKS